MKILYINTLYPPHTGGGAEKTLQTLVQGMRSRGHEVFVLTTGQRDEIIEDKISGVRIFRSKLANLYWHHQEERPPSWKRLIWHLFDIYNPVMGAVVSKAILNIRPDVVSIHNLAGFSVATWRAIRRSQTPMIQVLHDLYNLCPNSNMYRNGKACAQQCTLCKFFRLFHPKFSKAVDAVVGVSRFVLERHLQNNLFHRAGIKRVIHNVRLIRPMPRKSHRPENNQVIFGYMGTLTPAKGIEMLLDVFKNLNLPNTNLLVAGKGKKQYEESLIARFASSKIRFVGFFSPERFFPMIDILIVPSIWEEALGMVIPEAWAFGVPVIGARRGGIPEMIKPGKNGYLFDPEHPEDLASIISEITKSPHTIESLIPNAVASAKPFLDVQHWTAQWESIYREIMQLNRIRQ